MGIFSRIKSAVTKTASAIKSTASKVYTRVDSKVGGVLPGGAPKSVATTIKSSMPTSQLQPTKNISSVQNFTPSSSGVATNAPTTATKSPTEIKKTGTTWYQNADIALRGWLPFGVTRTEAQGLLAGREATALNYLGYQEARQTKADEAIFYQNQQQDLYNESWVDKIKGIFTTTPEEVLQKSVQGQLLENAGVSEYGMQKAGTTNWGNILLWGVGIGAVAYYAKS